ncbi:uncharacterized protein RCO7_11545 [Rhynchosporium graminicola]|uniref:Uncharacterized protein n=1 Tax=Rhynchosporium graminicola TaxID=2792576 RepID=A0A1E1LEX4_9HELO|nr:uncharacterized protein RCO7_11545 [Rhynchosporium commune]
MTVVARYLSRILTIGREMSDERFSASTPTVPESADGTPPERQIRLPLTPSATDELPSTLNPKSPVSAVLHLIKQRQHYNSTDQSRQLKVKPSDYKSLLARLQQLPELQSFVNDKLRLEYNPLENVLYLPRMPTTIHESFSERVSGETKAQLQRIRDGNDEAARFAARISSVRSGSIQLREIDSDDDTEIDRPYIQRQPDDQFQHDEAEYPGVVYEVACSQDSRDLRKAAWTYIPYSNANIKAVVGFELGYGTDKEARISMWKPRYLKEDGEGLETLNVEAVIDRDVFRSSDGLATNTTKALHLPLDWFADSEVATFNSEGLPGITITYAQLAEFLDKAERLQRTRQPVPGEESISKKSRRRTKKRRRPSTPIEEISSDQNG